MIKNWRDFDTLNEAHARIVVHLARCQVAERHRVDSKELCRIRKRLREQLDHVYYIYAEMFETHDLERGYKYWLRGYKEEAILFSHEFMGDRYLIDYGQFVVSSDIKDTRGFRIKCSMLLPSQIYQSMKIIERHILVYGLQRRAFGNFDYQKIIPNDTIR